MSDRGHVFVSNGTSVDETAKILADRLGARIAPRTAGQRAGAVYLSRESFSDAEYDLTVAVAENDVFGPPANGEDDALYAYFETELEIQVTGQGRRADLRVLRGDTERVFEVAVGLGWSAADVEIGGFARSAWSPELGRTNFPDGTSFGPSGRATWHAYATR